MKKKIFSIATFSAVMLAVMFFVGNNWNELQSRSSEYDGKIVNSIIFDGLTHTSEKDLRKVISTKEGSPLVAEDISLDIKALFAEGNFQDVKAFVDKDDTGVKIKFTCKESALISKIEYIGLDKLSETDFMDILLIKESGIYRKDLVEKTLNAIENKYLEKGYFRAVVNYRIKPDEKKKGQVRVIFVIDEGEEIRISKISILGTKNIKPSKLKGVMKSKKKFLVIRDGAFQREIYEQDKQKIVAYCQQKGFLDAKIVSDKVEYEWLNPEKKEKRGIHLTIEIEEGEQYFFDGYSVVGNEKIPTKKFQKNFKQSPEGNAFVRAIPKWMKKPFTKKRKDVVFNNTSFMMDLQMIHMMYGSNGYIYTRVNPVKEIEERVSEIDGKTRKYVKVDFQVAEGKQAYIENIIIKGNKKTKDYVIRREILVQEGKLFDTQLVQATRERVYNLGYFKEVNVDIRPGSKADYVNLIVDVREQPTGTISMGGGYGTQTGFSIFADIGQKNFRGKGQDLTVRVEYGPLKKNLSVTFKEPWLFKLPMSFNGSVFFYDERVKTSSIFSNSSTYANYDKLSTGYSLGLGYRFFRYYGVGGSFSHVFTSIKNPSGNCPDTVFQEEAHGWQNKRTVGWYVYRDSRNNYMNPTRGWMAKFGMYYTGGVVLRGDDHFIKYRPEISAYWSPFHLPFLKTHPCVFEVRASADFLTPPYTRSHIKQDPSQNAWLETDDFLDLGGPETIRGWDYYDTKLPSSWRNGLYHRMLYGIEFRIPILPQYLWAVVFFDAGAMWSDRYFEKNLSESRLETALTDHKNGDLYYIQDLFKKETKFMSYFKYSWGFGFKVQIPMMPLRFWFGRKLLWVDGKGLQDVSDRFTFQFTIGDIRY